MFFTIPTDSEHFARVCEQCGKGMNAGYVIGGAETYCSDACLYTDGFTEAEYLELYDDGESDTYWTEWEEIAEGENVYDAEGNDLGELEKPITEAA